MSDLPVAPSDSENLDLRWIILTETGEISLLGRVAPPSEEELPRHASALLACGMNGWLATMDRSAFSAGQPVFEMIRPLGSPTSLFSDAVATWRQTRVAKLSAAMPLRRSPECP